MEEKRILNVVSGFLGAGKTTFISKLIDANPLRESVSVCVNEFASQGVDGIVFNDKLTDVTELSSGCICCNLKDILKLTLIRIVFETQFNRLFIEPSGIGKLSDIMVSINSSIARKHLVIGKTTTVVDAVNFYKNIRDYAEIFIDQIKYSDSVVLSKTNHLNDKDIGDVIDEIRKINPNGEIFKESWDLQFIQTFYTHVLSENSVSSAIAGSGVIEKPTIGTSDMFQNLVQYIEKNVDESKLRQVLERIIKMENSNIVRIKGILKGQEELSYKVDFVQGILSIEPTRLKPTKSIVFIGQNLNYSHISQSLNDL